MPGRDRRRLAKHKGIYKGIHRHAESSSPLGESSDRGIPGERTTRDCNCKRKIILVPSHQQREAAHNWAASLCVDAADLESAGTSAQGLLPYFLNAAIDFTITSRA